MILKIIVVAQKTIKWQTRNFEFKTLDWKKSLTSPYSMNKTKQWTIKVYALVKMYK